MDANAVQPRNASSPMAVTPEAVSVASELHPANAFAPMEVQEDGRTTVVSAVHPLNVSSGMDVIEVVERSIDVSVVHPASAPAAMFDTEEATVTAVGLA